MRVGKKKLNAFVRRIPRSTQGDDIGSCVSFCSKLQCADFNRDRVVISSPPVLSDGILLMASLKPAHKKRLGRELRLGEHVRQFG